MKVQTQFHEGSKLVHEPSNQCFAFFAFSLFVSSSLLCVYLEASSLDVELVVGSDHENLIHDVLLFVKIKPYNSLN
jgi:hypothetical protein